MGGKGIPAVLIVRTNPIRNPRYHLTSASARAIPRNPKPSKATMYRNCAILGLSLLCVSVSLWSKRRNKPAALTMLLRALPVPITSRWCGVHTDGSGVVFIGIASGPFQPRGSLSGGAHHRLLVSIKACQV